MANVEVDLRGMRRLRRALRSGRARKIIRDEVGRQIKLATMQLRRNVVRYIETQRHGVPNSPLTVLAKGSSKPLVDRGDLRQGIVTDFYALPSSLVGVVGVKRSRKTKDGKKLVNVALALHNGAVVEVTPAVRAAVFAAIRERTGRRVQFSGRGGSRRWRIKPRPFIKIPYDEFEPMAIRRIALGVKRAMESL